MQDQVLEFISKTGKPPYYSVSTYGLNIKGTRHPRRFLDVWKRHYDYTDKHVCVIGCNTGGMIFEMAEEVREATGIDGNLKNLNAALKTMSLLGLDHHLNFMECHQELTNFHKFDQMTDDAELFIMSCDTIYGDWFKWFDLIDQKKASVIFEIEDKKDNDKIHYWKEKGRDPKLILKGSPDEPSKKRSSYLIER